MEMKRSSDRSTLSRRNFLTGAALAGVSTVAIGALGGCSPSGESQAGTAPSNINWDQEVDIIVAGGGMSLFAALMAHMKGENVLLIEKRGVLGGTAALSGGKVWVPMNTLQDETQGADDRQGAIDYIKKVSEGLASDELIEAFVDGSGEFFDWSFNELGFPWEVCVDVIGPAWDAYMPVEGYKLGRALKIESSYEEGIDGSHTGGPAIFNWLIPKAEEEELPTLMDTAVTRLITNENSEVIGVEAQSGQSTKYIKANKGVVLATGGFDHDTQMLIDYQRTVPRGLVAVETNTGDGIKMGIDIGADLAQMQANWGCPMYASVDDVFEHASDPVMNIATSDIYTNRGYPHSIIVDQDGTRFGNESANYHTFNRCFEAWDAGADHMSKPIPGYLIVDGTFLANYPLPCTDNEVGVIPEEAIQADTLEELAERIGINSTNFNWQIEQFNQFAETGYDPQFHRGENLWDLGWTGYGGSQREPELTNPCLGKLETPPFVALAI